MAEEASESSPQPVVQANFGRVIGEKKFFSIEEFVQWTTRNREAFRWLTEIQAGDQRTSPGRDQQWGALERLVGAANALKAALEAGDATSEQSARAALLQNIEKYYRKKWILPAEDARTQFLSELAKTDKLAAAMALGFFLKISGTPTDLPQLSAQVRAIVFELGIHDTAENERSALQLLANDWQRRMAAFGETAADSQAELRKFKASTVKATKDQNKGFADAQGERKQAFGDLLAQSSDRLAGLEKWYAGELSLHSAVQYWAKKAVIHRTLGAFAAVATASSAFVYFTMILPTQFSEILEKLGVDLKDSTWRIGVAAGLILLGIWLVRILVRLTLSQIHLATDAAHRRILIRTYLALLKNESQAVTPEDRSKVLEVVFRPISDGIIRDDAMPPSPWELITRTPRT